jgi:hypothetical protein
MNAYIMERACLALLVLVGASLLAAGTAPRRAFTAVPAVQYAHLSPYTHPTAYARPMVLAPPTGEVRIAALALMPAPGNDEEPLAPAPLAGSPAQQRETRRTIRINWPRVLSTALILAGIGYISSTYDSQSTDTSVLNTIAKWLSDPPMKEVPAAHYDDFGIPVGKQTRMEVNGGSVFLLAGPPLARVLAMKAREKQQQQQHLEQQARRGTDDVTDV